MYAWEGVDYYESIHAQMKNADSDAFNYKFSVSGTIPHGISYQYDGQLLVFHGVPTVTGTYKFTVKVEIQVGIYGPGDGICFGKDYDKRDYEIIVMSAQEN